MTKIIIVSWIFIFSLTLVVCRRYELGNSQEWGISWGNFNKNLQDFNIENLISGTLLQFHNTKSKDLRATNIGYTQNGYSYLRYQEKSCSNKQIERCNFFYLIGKNSEAFFKINNPEEKQIIFSIKEGITKQPNTLILSRNGILRKNFELLDKVCQKKDQIFNCKINAKQIFIGIISKQFYSTLKQTQQVFLSHTDYNEVSKSINFQMSKLLKKYYVDQSKAKIGEIMLTQTLDSICYQNSEYEDIKYFGLCKQNSGKYQIQLHYSLLIVQILLQYNYKLGSWLFENYLNFIEEKMFYSDYDEQEWIAIPQHIQVTSSFLKTVKFLQEKQAQQKQKNKVRIKKVQKILNGFINQILLSQVNHLSQEINYRQSNKLHPTLLKMLTINWKGTNPKKMGLSIYDESFTNDFYYHQKTQTVSNNVGKIMWLIKLLKQYIDLFKNYGNSFQKQSLQQAVSLAKVVHGYSLDDPNTKNGDFYSIIKSENLRVYCRQFGYQSFLPYVYEVTKVFPQNTLKNLTTSFGLASMSPLSLKVNQKYNFRGNIHLYFNYKILFKSLFLSISEPSDRRFYTPIKQMTIKYQEKILQTYNKWQKDKKGQFFYSQWTLNGIGVKSDKFLAVINAVFLTSIKEFDTKMQVQGQKNKEK